jgi:hypothetical protein
MRPLLLLALCALGCSKPVGFDDIGTIDFGLGAIDLAVPSPDIAGTCTDGALNGRETDVDCGGPDCRKCTDGKRCSVADDCGSADCANNLCVSCTDRAKNGSETDIDCGGAICPPCADGRACLTGSDCASGDCSGAICIAPPDGSVDGAPGDALSDGSRAGG